MAKSEASPQRRRVLELFEKLDRIATSHYTNKEMLRANFAPSWATRAKKEIEETLPLLQDAIDAWKAALK